MSLVIRNAEIVGGTVSIDMQYERFDACRFVDVQVDVIGPPNAGPLFVDCQFIRGTIKAPDASLFERCIYEAVKEL
jgi:hypothetical protein